MIVESIESIDSLQRLEAEWSHLQDEAGTLPFTSWEWNVAWWKHFSRKGLITSDRLYVRAIRDAAGGLVGIAPLVLTERPAKGLRLRCLQFFGADPNLTEVRGLLCRKSDELAVYEALLRDLFERSAEWDCFLVGGISAEGGVAGLLERYGRPYWLDDVSCFVLELPSTWEEFRRTRSRNIKESLRKCTNSLRRDGLTPVFNVATGGPELESAVARLICLHGARATRADTVFHSNVFRHPEAAGFVHEVTARLRTHDNVRVFTMDIAGQTVAARLAFDVGRTLYLYYSGYDPAYAKYSVMTSVTAEAIKYAVDHGYATVNLSTGNDISKTRWSPTPVTFRQAALPSVGRYSRIATFSYIRLRALWLAGQIAQSRTLVRLKNTGDGRGKVA